MDAISTFTSLLNISELVYPYCPLYSSTLPSIHKEFIFLFTNLISWTYLFYCCYYLSVFLFLSIADVAFAVFFGIKYREKDDRQKTNFSFEGAKNRTGLRAKAINSAITGLDAGNPAVDGFSGALVCFPYDQKILTEKGKI